MMRRLGRRLWRPAAGREQGRIGPTPADVEMVRNALQAEATRVGRRERLSLSVMMEHTGLDLVHLELYAVLGYLQTQGEIVNVEQDSFGNLKFDLAD